MRREVGGRVKREGTQVYLWLIHVYIWQKPTQYCKASILQLKINKFNSKENCTGKFHGPLRQLNKQNSMNTDCHFADKVL